MNDDNNARPSWQTPANPDYSYGAQPGPYAVPAQPPAPVIKPKRTGWKWFGGLIAFLFGLVIVGGIIGTATDPGRTAQLPTEATTKAGASKSTVPPAVAKKWVPLTTVTGGTEKTSDTIRTVGGKIRVSWTFTGGQYAAGAIYLLNEGTDLQEDGGVPVAMIDEASTKDSIVLRKAAGEYFVQVTAANAKYTVKVEEER